MSFKRIIISFTFISFVLFASPAFSQSKIIRPTIVIDFPNNGPDFQFYRLLDVNDTQSRWRYTIHWDSIIEYSDTDQNGIFNSSIDTIVRNISFSDINFWFVKKSANLTGVQNQVVSGSKMLFTGNDSIGNNVFSVIISIGWWNDVVNIPYGNNSITVTPSQSKYSIAIKNWNFSSNSDQLAVLTSIETTTNITSYDFTNYGNGTVSMITKKDPDGNGKRGGIIDNPKVALIDNQSLKPAKMNFFVKNNKINLQYSFPYFKQNILYDPAYSAIAIVSTNTSHSGSNTVGVGGFGLGSFSILFVTYFIIHKRKRHK